MRPTPILKSSAVLQACVTLTSVHYTAAAAAAQACIALRRGAVVGGGGCPG
jgi:hypothetical protein